MEYLLLLIINSMVVVAGAIYACAYTDTIHYKLIDRHGDIIIFGAVFIDICYFLVKLINSLKLI